MGKNVWILIDNRAGSNGQARGIAKALGWQTTEKNISYNGWANLPNLFLGATLRGVEPRSRETLKPPFPDLVIAASRRSAPVARWIKKRTFGQVKIVQVMHPGSCGLKDFDRVFVSDHDDHKKHSPNIFYVTGCAHRITPETLAEGREKWEKEFAGLSRPLTAVIVGGTFKGHDFTVENAREFGRQVREYKEKIGGSILITDSRRTGIDAQEAIMQEIEGIPTYSYLWDKDLGQNPYLGFLGCADDLIVTGDSVSMCCEACGTGKKVQIYSGKKWLDAKHKRFLNKMFSRKLAFPLGTEIPEGTEFRAFNPASEIAAEIKKLFPADGGEPETPK